MNLTFYDSEEGFKRFVDLDLDTLIDCLIKERKYLKCGRGQGINNILSTCILRAASKTDLFGNELPDIFSIEVYNTKRHE